MMRPSPREPQADLTLGQSRFRILGIKRYDLRDPYHALVTMTWPQFLATLLGLYLLVNVAFAALYRADPHALVNGRSGSLLDAFFFSFETLATVGYGEMYPGSLYGHLVVCLELICGIAFTAILTGLTFVRFSRPRAKFVFADHMVVAAHNGKPTLMLRVGNGRPGLLADVRVRIAILLREESIEGNMFLRTHELPLIRGHLPVMPLAWTVMHEIAETSPLHGMDVTALTESEIRIFVSMEARDPSLGAMVYDLRQFQPDQITFGAHYTDAIRTDEDGTPVLDLSKISNTAMDRTEPAQRAGMS